MNLIATYYRGILLEMHRGNYRGIISNAKPLFFLAILKAIDKGDIIANKIDYSEKLRATFYEVSKEYNPSSNVTPFEKPFFHMDRESFYFIKYKDGIKPPRFAQSPSAKFLRENVEYAYFDDQLWELLQDIETREEYKQTIINHFLKN